MGHHFYDLTFCFDKEKSLLYSLGIMFIFIIKLSFDRNIL